MPFCVISSRTVSENTLIATSVGCPNSTTVAVRVSTGNAASETVSLDELLCGTKRLLLSVAAI